MLRMMFRDSRVRAAQSDWENVARYVVAAFRADVARAGAARNVQALVDELCATSAEFAAMWRDNDVQAHGDGTKTCAIPWRAALYGVFGLRRRRPARSQHGDLQSRDASRRGQDPRAAQIEKAGGGVTTAPFTLSNSSSLWSASGGLTPSAQQSARTRCAWRRRYLAFDA